MDILDMKTLDIDLSYQILLSFFCSAVMELLDFHPKLMKDSGPMFEHFVSMEPVFIL